jgi:aldose 1-epimerase
VDNCFAGWSRRAIGRWRDKGLSLTMTADPVFGTIVVFSPQGQDFFCVEPVTHLNNGINLRAAGVAQTGVVDLLPGQSLSGAVHFEIEED